MIEVTNQAVNQLQLLLERKNLNPAEQGLRLAVEKGGCAGMQYTMALSEPAADDRVVDAQGVRVFVDAASADFLDGCELDYEDSLMEAGFKISNPNAARSCSCGSSFDACPQTA